MTDDTVYMDFEEPTHLFDTAPGASKDPRRGKKTDDEGEALPIGFIPVLPKREPLPSGEQEKRGVSNRDRSAANLKVEGYSYSEIAELLEFKDAAAARSAVERTLALIHTDSELDTLRLVVARRFEEQFKRSFRMAGADYLVDDDTGQKLPNTDKLRWHTQAGVDLMNYATVTGAKAPARLEITPGEAELDRIVGMMLKQGGYEEVLEAEVIEFHEIEAPIPEED